MIIKNVEYDGEIFATEKEDWAKHTKKYGEMIEKSEIYTWKNEISENN